MPDRGFLRGPRPGVCSFALLIFLQQVSKEPDRCTHPIVSRTSLRDFVGVLARTRSLDKLETRGDGARIWEVHFM
jgi:hypothetical protein